ncbi:microfibril-associated glycoprotein 4-like [Patiria miniata]|uniref:Uncharacterized protein n=1 Tax=Patiria miniata TaxID=46514 RepID=A0A914ANY7_PATMI|nr:microfibril-associated glycoprotein 4-like [Patiria miniata]
MLITLLSAALVLSIKAQNSAHGCSFSLQDPPDFYLAENRALNYSAYQEIHGVSAAMCARNCHLDSPRCASFNYQQASGVCKLNNATRKDRPVDLLELGGSSYYDRSDETLLCSAPLEVYNSSCQMLFRAGHRASGVYTIYPVADSVGVPVYCDMETDGGGWMVIQRRRDGTEDFSRVWVEYQSGFGDMHGEFWLGNDIVRDVTASGSWQLIVDLGDWEGNTAWAEYGEFGLSGSEYQLRVGSYNPASTAGDSLQRVHDGVMFTTKDRDHDSAGGNCADDYPGAWWFVLCLESHLNGVYRERGYINEGKGIIWGRWKGFHESLKQCSMKIREVKCYHRLP